MWESTDCDRLRTIAAKPSMRLLSLVKLQLEPSHTAMAAPAMACRVRVLALPAKEHARPSDTQSARLVRRVGPSRRCFKSRTTNIDIVRYGNSIEECAAGRIEASLFL